MTFASLTSGGDAKTIPQGTTVVDATAFGLEPEVGSLFEFAPADHSHGSPAEPAPPVFFGESGTYTVPDGVGIIRVLVVGGGGGGSSAAANGDSDNGGNSGSSAEQLINVAAGDSFTVNVGAGGLPGTPATGFGGSGGTTSFTKGAQTFLSAIGGGSDVPASTGQGQGGSSASSHEGAAGNIGDFGLTGGGGAGYAVEGYASGGGGALSLPGVGGVNAPSGPGGDGVLGCGGGAGGLGQDGGRGGDGFVIVSPQVGGASGVPGYGPTEYGAPIEGSG